MNCPKEALKEDFKASQGELPDQVNSDQIVLGTFRREAGPRERWPCLAHLDPVPRNWFRIQYTGSQL
jgi:hypothetical protein